MRTLATVFNTGVAALALCFACTTSAGDEAASSTSETGAETGDACELPENATPSEAATIAIRNDRAEPIYLLPYSSFPCNYGKLEIEVGGEPVLWNHASTYPYDCSASLCDYGCSDGGDMGLIINPGATAEIEWGGGIWARKSLSQACQDAAGCEFNPPGDTCDVLEIVSGEYLVRVNLTTSCPGDNGCPDCADEVCEWFFYEPSPADVSESFEATGTFPNGVEIVVN